MHENITVEDITVRISSVDQDAQFTVEVNVGTNNTWSRQYVLEIDGIGSKLRSFIAKQVCDQVHDEVYELLSYMNMNIRPTDWDN